MSCMNGFRLPAEWERHAFTQITWPSLCSDWDYMMAEVEDCYVRLAGAIAAFEPLLIVTDDEPRVRRLLGETLADRVSFFVCPVNDTWARDHGFFTVVDSGGDVLLADFQFNGWGLKFAAAKDNLINHNLHNGPLKANPYRSFRKIVLEGGSIESDGQGTILTTSCCLMADNRNWFETKAEAEAMLKDCFNCQRVMWLDHGELVGDDTDGHVDTLARLAPSDTIVYVGRPAESDEQYETLAAMEEELKALRTAEGKPYRLVALPCTAPILDKDDASRLPATYANFYFVNGAILMPTYNVPTDREAMAIMSAAFPGLEVVGVDCRALIRQHGSLHCSTMQFPAGVRLSAENANQHLK